MILVAVILFITFSACKKEKATITEKKFDSYMPFKKGNFWVYENFTLDSSGVQIDRSYDDTLYVSNDSTINGNKYYEIKWKKGSINLYQIYNNWLRDSSGYIVDINGERMFSSVNFSDTLRVRKDADFPMWKVILFYKMDKSLKSIATRAGNFEALNCKAEVYSNEQGNVIQEFINTFYAKSIGIVEANILFLDNPENRITTRLNSYYLQ